MSCRLRSSVSTFAVLLALLVPATWGRSEAVRPPADRVALGGPTLGWSAGDDAPAGEGVIAPGAEGRVVVRLRAAWDEIEATPGTFDWSRILERATAWDRAGAVVAVTLAGSHPAHAPDAVGPSPFVPGSVEAWTEFARSAVRDLQGRALVFEIAPGHDGGEPDPEIYAFVLKRTSIAIRAEARASGVQALVAQLPVAADRPGVQIALWDADIAPYTDVLPVVLSPDDDPVLTLRAFREAALGYPPASSPWAVVRGSDARGRALAALSAGAAVAIIEPAPGDDPAVWASQVQAALAEGFAPAPPEAATFGPESDGSPSRARLVATYFSDTSFETLLVVDPGGARSVDDPLEVVVPSAFVRNARSIDPSTASERRIAARPVAGDDRSRSLSVEASGEAPVLVRYQSAAPLPEGVEAPEEDVAVDRARGLTAQEIIARYQEVQKRQDDRLARWTANAKVDFHFRFAQGGPTVDVTILSNYFWERGGDLEWEQTEYFVNGNKVRWKNIPELPLIQPEKVVTLPLDLTLDKTYAYRLAGEERVGDRDAYVLTFEPKDGEPSRSLYRGRVWVDRETFVRLRANVVQTGLDVPVLSNEETDTYRPVEGPDGETYWMLGDIAGQQVWNAAGRNFVVRREVEFLTFEINPPADRFEAARDRAYASNNQMLRDTDEGFRYLERQEDGGRTVKSGVDTSQLFALGGAFSDSSTDGVIPLAGVNYFNYDLGGRDVQTNVFFAGVLAFGTLTVPDLFERRIDVTVDAGLTALHGDDKVFRLGEEVEALRLRDRTQRSQVRVGIPLGSFAKANLIGRVNWVDFADSDEGRDARPTGVSFVLPEDHRETTVGVELLFNRRGWELEAEASRSRRSVWRPWGLFDDVQGAFVDPEYEPAHQSFEEWAVSLRREWYLPRFQKIRAEVTALGGSDFDRFSEYTFSFFGDDRLFGFSGSGVRFDRGTVVRAGYLFNLFEAIRFQASAETARVRSERDLGEYRRHTGVGLSGNVIGPWKTVVNVDVGYSLSSDIPELEGEFEALLVILKLF